MSLSPPTPTTATPTTALQRFPLAVRRLARRLFDSRRGAERQRAQRFIGLIDELLPAEVDKQSKREIHGDKIRLEMSPALSFSIVVSISLSALSASPRLCVRFPLRHPSPLPLPPPPLPPPPCCGSRLPSVVSRVVFLSHAEARRGRERREEIDWVERGHGVEWEEDSSNPLTTRT